MSNSVESIAIAALLYVKEGQWQKFRDFENRAIAIMARYGGTLERAISPASIIGDLPLPDEIHILSFKSQQDFERYRADEELLALKPLRDRAIEKTILVFGSFLSPSTLRD